MLVLYQSALVEVAHELMWLSKKPVFVVLECVRVGAILHFGIRIG